MHFSFRVLLHFFIDSCKALLIISYVKRRYIKWKIIIINIIIIIIINIIIIIIIIIIEH